MIMLDFLYSVGPKRVDANSLLGTNPRMIELEASRIQQGYENHAGLVQISQVYAKRKVLKFSLSFFLFVFFFLMK